jgi:predicted secreted protein
MNNFFLALIIFLQVADGCQHIPAGRNQGDDISGKVPRKIVHEKCADQIEIHLLDTVVFQFTEISGRGYAWSFVAPDSLSQIMKASGVKRYILEDKDGAEERVEFYFKAVSRGMTTLKFKYFRPWEKTKPAADSCITQISIK